MNTLLIFFAFPVAVIIFSIILEKVLKCAIAIAALVFAIFLIVTFAVFDETFLIATLVYTAIAFITASIVNWIQNYNVDNDLYSCNTVENIQLNSNNTCNSNCGCNRCRRRF